MSEVGRHSQWNTGPANAVAIQVLRFQDDDGRLALADSGDTDAYLAEDDDRLVLDDTVTAGTTIFTTPTRIMV